MAAGPLYMASARTAQKTPLPSALLLLRASLLRLSRDGYWAIVFTEPSPSIGCLCWLHSSCFQQICHKVMICFMTSCVLVGEYQIFARNILPSNSCYKVEAIGLFFSKAFIITSRLQNVIVQMIFIWTSTSVEISYLISMYKISCTSIYFYRH
jgi:hypothetical protein